MLVRTSKPKEVEKAKEYFEKLLNTECSFNLTKILQTRTAKQNRALHLYWTFVSTELNNLGMEFRYLGLSDKGFTSRYTMEIVKEFIWRPIQISMFNIKSTTKINTTQINEIIDVITKYFGDKGVTVDFPNIEQLIK